MQSSLYDNISTDFFKEGIINYTKKQFTEFTKCLEIIYSSHFELQFIKAVFFEKIEIIKSIIESNRLSKLWLVYAETIQSESTKLNDLFKKEINSKTCLTLINGFKDKDIANINLIKSQLVSLIIVVCIKTNINKDDMSILKDSQVKVVELFNWLNTFAQYKSLEEESGRFIKEIILKLPLIVTSQSTMMNIVQLKWLEGIFTTLNVNKEWYEKELREMLEAQEKKRNVFGKLMQAAREMPKQSRSRMQSMDKNDTGTNRNEDKDKDKIRDNKIYRYFKPLSKQSNNKEESSDNKSISKGKESTEQSKEKSNKAESITANTNANANSNLNANANMPSQSQNTFTFGVESSLNDDAYSRYSESNTSKKDMFFNPYHFKTSYSNLKLYRNYSNLSSSALSINSLNAYSNPIPGLYDSNVYSHQSSSGRGGGINSLLKSKMHSYLNIPTIHKPRHLSRSRDKEHSLHKKLTNRIINDENYNSQNMPIELTTNKKDAGDTGSNKLVDFKNLIKKNFYQINNEEEEVNKSEPPSPVFTKRKSNDTQQKTILTKTKQATLSRKKGLGRGQSSNKDTNDNDNENDGNEDDVLVYLTPNKITFQPRKNSLSPCTTRKNLLTLFQQVNK